MKESNEAEEHETEPGERSSQGAGEGRGGLEGQGSLPLPKVESEGTTKVPPGLKAFKAHVRRGWLPWARLCIPPKYPFLLLSMVNLSAESFLCVVMGLRRPPNQAS